MKNVTHEAYRMLTCWKHSYLDTRAKIETLGRDARWEFDRRRLFDRTEYCALVVAELGRVARVRIHHCQQKVREKEKYKDHWKFFFSF